MTTWYRRKRRPGRALESAIVALLAAFVLMAGSLDAGMGHVANRENVTSPVFFTASIFADYIDTYYQF